MFKNDLITIDPETMGGTPVFTGSRVPIQSLFDYLEYGETMDVFLENFPGISRNQAVGVLRAASDLLKKEYSLHEDLA